MSEPAADNRLCPTRANGAHTLIAHWITPTACLERQRRNYHKCPSCQYLGASADFVAPLRPEPPPVEIVPAAPVQRKRSKKAKTLRTA